MIRYFLPLLSFCCLLSARPGAAIPHSPDESAIVCIESMLADNQRNVGTGFIIAPGIVATVEHQVRNSVKTFIYFPGKPGETAEVLIARQGMAILRTATKSNVFVPMARQPAATGTAVFSYGCSADYPDVELKAVKTQSGEISDTGRNDNGISLLESKLPIKKGNSGGPLLNEAGKVLGMITGFDAENPKFSVALPIGQLINLMARQQNILFEPAISALWQQAQMSSDTAQQLRLYDDILEKTPWHTEALYNQGLIYAEQHNYPLAREKLAESIAQRPDYYNAYLRLGAVLVKLKEFIQARDTLIQAVLLSPENPLAYLQLAGIYHDGFNDSVSERNALQQYSTLAPQDAQKMKITEAVEKIEHQLKLKP